VSTLDRFQDFRDRDTYTVVVADCSDCRSVHPLGRRGPVDGPAASDCPSCGSTRYATTTRTFEVGGDDE
jgi:hypothetical protein